jgi:hypothetical protein
LHFGCRDVADDSSDGYTNCHRHTNSYSTADSLAKVAEDERRSG